MTYSGFVLGFKRPISLWREADSNLRRLIWIGFIEMLAANTYLSLIVPFARTIGLGSGPVGSLNFVLQVISAVAAVGAGIIADRVGRKAVYVAGQTLRVVISVALIAAHSYLGLLIVFVLRGFGMIEFPASQALTANLTRRENRATMIGLSQTLAQVAFVLMPLVSGIIADRYGARLSFAIGAVFAVTGVIMGIGLKDRAVAGSDAAEEKPAEVGAVGDPLRERLRRMFLGARGRRLMGLMAAGALNGVASGAFSILLPFTVIDRFSSAYTTVAWANAVTGFGTMLVLLVGGRMADVGGRRKVVLTCGVAFPLLFATIFLIRTLWQLSLMLTITSMIGNLSYPALAAVQMEAVAARDRATYAGLQLCVNSAGMALGSVAAGVCYAVSPNLSWAGHILVCLLQVACYHFALPRDGRPASARAAVSEAV